MSEVSGLVSGSQKYGSVKAYGSIRDIPHSINFLPPGAVVGIDLVHGATNISDILDAGPMEESSTASGSTDSDSLVAEGSVKVSFQKFVIFLSKTNLFHACIA
jgi:hypothetical protein